MEQFLNRMLSLSLFNIENIRPSEMIHAHKAVYNSVAKTIHPDKFLKFHNPTEEELLGQHQAHFFKAVTYQLLGQHDLKTSIKEAAWDSLEISQRYLDEINPGNNVKSETLTEFIEVSKYENNLIFKVQPFFSLNQGVVETRDYFKYLDKIIQKIIMEER